MRTDTKFFTNEDGNSLLRRLGSILRRARFFDVIVGYFRASGFAQLVSDLEEVDKIRILVGLNADIMPGSASLSDHEDNALPVYDIVGVRREYGKSVEQEFESAPETLVTEQSIRQFLDFIRRGKLELRGHPSRNIHAKVYIIRYRDDSSFGSVITGSSNFSHSGLAAQREFNVELKDRGDVDFALERFEKLWEESIELTAEFVTTATSRTWLNDTVTPYELYLKFLYEYFKDDLYADCTIKSLLPDNYLDLEYQSQAVVAAKKILEAHNGVFLADVVGLGKTFISAILLQTLHGHKLIICPPLLKDYWEDALRQFSVYSATVISAGKIGDVNPESYSHYKYVLVDESHKFRNEGTQSYAQLKNICIGKKVILVSATPLNNRLSDILAQLKLFQPGQNSTIPGIVNLEAFFRAREKALGELDPTRPEFRAEADKIAATVRDKVLKYVMIRRTRREVSKYFSDDLKKNGMVFPTVHAPRPLIYQFDDKLDEAFEKTIRLLAAMTYARYTPLLYLKDGPTRRQAVGQINVRGFIRSILVKRLESSFYAFARTVGRIITSCRYFITTCEAGSVFIGKQVDIGELLDMEPEEAESFLLARGIEEYNAMDFEPQLIDDLKDDLAKLEEIASIWRSIDSDPKYECFFDIISNDRDLCNDRLIVFTESTETAEYIFANLEDSMPGAAMIFSSKGGIHAGKKLRSREARELIHMNFDPACPSPQGDFRILVTTDILAEGMNLHRAARILNYDLPWNPTRVMQRLGRINRVGTEHEDIFIYNFFPTSRADEHLGLNANVGKKIAAFNSVLGNDNKFLFEDENPDPHGLFGRLITLGDEEEDSELRYLDVIRKVRDEEPGLFSRIERLPPKVRSARFDDSHPDELIVFFREGALKKFVSVGKTVRELAFLDAAPLMEAGRNAARAPLPPDYYNRLLSARAFPGAENNGITVRQRQGVPARKILETIRVIQKCTDLPTPDRDYLSSLYDAVEQSALPRKSISALGAICRREQPTPLDLLAAMRAVVPSSILDNMQDLAPEPVRIAQKPKQVVLAQYLAPAAGGAA